MPGALEGAPTRVRYTITPHIVFIAAIIAEATSFIHFQPQARDVLQSHESIQQLYYKN